MCIYLRLCRLRIICCIILACAVTCHSIPYLRFCVRRVPQDAPFRRIWDALGTQKTPPTAEAVRGACPYTMSGISRMTSHVTAAKPA